MEDPEKNGKKKKGVVIVLQGCKKVDVEEQLGVFVKRALDMNMRGR